VRSEVTKNGNLQDFLWRCTGILAEFRVASDAAKPVGYRRKVDRRKNPLTCAGTRIKSNRKYVEFSNVQPDKRNKSFHSE
jgi:hypothetical protein